MAKAVDIKDGILFVRTRHYDDVKMVVVRHQEKPEKRFYKVNEGELIVIHNALGKTKYQCNQCQHYVKPSDDKNFCPNCGAKFVKQKRKGGGEHGKKYRINK